MKGLSKFAFCTIKVFLFHQRMHHKFVYEYIKIYIKIHAKIVPACFGLTTIHREHIIDLS